MSIKESRSNISLGLGLIKVNRKTQVTQCKTFKYHSFCIHIFSIEVIFIHTTVK